VEDTRVDISIDDNEDKDDKTAKKERPVWLVESTITQNVVLEVSEEIIIFLSFFQSLLSTQIFDIKLNYRYGFKGFNFVRKNFVQLIIKKKISLA